MFQTGAEDRVQEYVRGRIGGHDVTGKVYSSSLEGVSKAAPDDHPERPFLISGSRNSPQGTAASNYKNSMKTGLKCLLAACRALTPCGVGSIPTRPTGFHRFE